MKKLLALIILSAFVFAACGGRVPKPQTSEHVMKSYFKRYGHKFKTSDFGTSKIDKINVLQTEEIHKNLAAVTGEVIFTVAPTYNVRCVMQKKTLGWKMLSWEKL